MGWTELLRSELQSAYATTGLLLEKVDPNSLDWKPPSGSNWMTVGQLLKHISNACGSGCRGFVSGDWGLPPGKSLEDLPPEEQLPPAEKLPSVRSVDEARRLLADDEAVAMRMIGQAGESDLEGRKVAAPWSPGQPLPLGQQLLRMIQHLERHKSQLFYYLKLQGKRVDTVDLWG